MRSDLRPDLRDELHRLERLADLLDSRFRIPGTGIRIGLDSLIGLIPGIGDSATLIASCYLIARAERLGAPGDVLTHMIVNVLIDWLVGMVPVLGDIFDIGFRANRRNIDLLRRHLDETMRDRGGLYLSK